MLENRAFTAANRYVTGTKLNIGTGVPACFDEAAVKNDCLKRTNTETKLHVFEIALPPISSFITLENSLSNLDSALQLQLFSEKSVTALFQKDFLFFKKQVRSFCKPETNDDFLPAFDNEKINFFNQRRAELLALKTIKDYVLFVKERFDNNAAASSAYLSHCGVTGIIYTAKEGKRVLVFDAARDITIIASKRY